MRIRCFWPSCTFRGGTWEASPIDAFWVEATYEEAHAHVFHLLSAQQIVESCAIADEFKSRHCTAMINNSERPFCFLVAHDLSSIEPFHPHYPTHHMWNAYSPFKPLPEINIASLNELCSVIID